MDGGGGARETWLLLGVGGVLGRGLAESPPAVDLVVAGRVRPPFWIDAAFAEADLEEPGALALLVRELRPTAILNAAALSRVGDCESDPARARRVNVEALEELLDAAAAARARVVQVSTDQVFAGTTAADRPYREHDRPEPQNVYGRSKAEAEARALSAQQTVVRLPLLLGPPGREGGGADAALLAALARGEAPRLFVDELRSPIASALLAEPLWRLLAEPRPGVFHLAGSDCVSRWELGAAICAAAGVDADLERAHAADWTGPPRPLRLPLGSARAREELGWSAPDLRQSLARSRAHRS